MAVEHARRRRLQSGLLVLGIALGVAVGVAVDIANASALSAFRVSTEALAGRSTHRIVAGSEGLDEDVYRRVRVDAGLADAAPVVEAPVVALGQRLTLLGVDPLAEPTFRSLLPVGPGDETLTSLVTTPGAVALAEGTAARAGLVVGDRLTIAARGAEREAVLAAVLRPADASARRALEGIVLADIGAAQEILGREGRLDRIDLRLPEDAAAAAEVRARLAAVLPPGAAIVAAGEQRASLEGLTDAFRLNLTALSLLALLVGMFLIFNTVRLGVVQRRRTLATLRVLGVTRAEVFAVVLGEAALLGAIGAALGLALGVVLGRGAVDLVTRTIDDLFFATTVRDVAVPATALARGALMGIGAALVAAFVPALEATAVAPAAALRRSDVETSARRAVPVALAAAVAMAVLGALLLAVPGGRVDVAFASLFAVVLAFALATPAWALALLRLVGPAMRRLGVVGVLAPRAVSRSLSRTAVAMAALTVAVCVSIGVQVMVGSFRRTVEEWLAVTLQADVFISTRGVGAGEGATLGPALVADLVALPGVVDHSTAREVSLRSPDLGPVEVVAVLEDLAGDDRRYVDARGTPREVWAAVEGGSVIVSEPLALRHGLGVGDRLTLLGDREAVGFPIAGVFHDYGSTAGVAYMADAVYRRHWDDAAVTSVALDAAPGTVDEDLAAAARTTAASRQDVVVSSNRALREAALEVFDRAFAITAALRILAIVVAFIGVLSALLALQLERAREHATLRATGLTRGQLAGLTLLETGLVGAVAGLASWPAGLTLALMLIHIINRRSFGWTIFARLEPGPFLAALGLAVAAALLAGTYPAWRLGRLPIARALREE